MYRFYIFDLDGTLVNSLADLADSTNHALAQLGLPGHPEEAYRYFVGDGVPMLLRRAAPPNTAEETLARLHSLFDQYYAAHCFDKTKPYAGCEALLAGLNQRGAKTSVLSNKPDAFVGEIVRRLFPAHPFAAVFGKRPQFAKKPDPAALIAMIEELGVPKEQCLYIGDSNVDVFTAHNAGVACCGALWGFRGYEELRKAGAEYFARQPLEVLKAGQRPLEPTLEELT